MLRRIVVTLTLAASLGLAGCHGDEPADPAPSGVEAFPDPPYVDGPLAVELQSALPQMNDPERYRPLGSPHSVVIEDVSTEPSADHTSWGWTARFSVGSRATVRRMKSETTALGGVVLVTIAGKVVTVVAPSYLAPRRAARLGLPKTEAWAVVDAFSRSKQGM